MDEKRTTYEILREAADLRTVSDPEVAHRLARLLDAERREQRYPGFTAEAKAQARSFGFVSQAEMAEEQRKLDRMSEKEMAARQRGMVRHHEWMCSLAKPE